MPVYQDFGPGIGAGISAGVQGFMAGRDRKRQSDIFEQEMADHMAARTLQRAQLAQQGVHILAPGEAMPFKGIANDIADRAPQVVPTLDDRLPQLSPLGNNGSAPGSNPAAGSAMPTSRAGAGALNIPGHPAARSVSAAEPSANGGDNLFQSLMAQMGGQAMPDRGPRYETGQGYYIDHKPAWDQQDQARAIKIQDQFEPMLVQHMVAADERNRKIQDYVRAGVPADRASLYLDNPALADNDPRVGKPQTRSLEHVDAGDRIEVRDALTGKLVNTIPKGIAPVSPEVQAIRDAALGTRKDSLASRTEARLVGQYHDATKKYSQTADALQAIAENRAGALKGDPVAQQTLLQDFIKLNLPGQVVTADEMHNYAGLMGLGEKGGQLLEKLRQGSPLGAQQIKLILSHADNLAAERRKGAKFLRDTYVQRGARQGVPEDSFEDWFGFLPSDEKASAPPQTSRDPGGNINLGDTSLNPFSSLIPAGKKP